MCWNSSARSAAFSDCSSGGAVLSRRIPRCSASINARSCASHSGLKAAHSSASKGLAALCVRPSSVNDGTSPLARSINRISPRMCVAVIADSPSFAAMPVKSRRTPRKGRDALRPIQGAADRNPDGVIPLARLRGGAASATRSAGATAGEQFGSECPRAFLHVFGVLDFGRVLAIFTRHRGMPSGNVSSRSFSSSRVHLGARRIGAIERMFLEVRRQILAALDSRPRCRRLCACSFVELPHDQSNASAPRRFE